MTEQRYTIQITALAEADLQGIRDYLVEHDAREAANKLIDALMERAASLETFPLRGSIPAEAEAGGRLNVRQLVLPPYRLIYTVAGTMVTVQLIADGRRDLRALLQQRLLMPRAEDQ
ncbi:type II toxin-antitoxin system RelE/ParE family toxin [Sphingomonas sp.]|uniref:type II toxin-antitoxin system RelE/ParE family toxin n=1 Tax=Sphingomonas sp. TaxID=28214 RepID=UPI001B083C39|nr:type II toxin-antitoxin system RelE/ParE family toxin [Sphingomonas sp.]MBO9711425.1 type II toxin-antitoxin system RelE/ParE family toxin [Sphingomonas sp.]